MGLGDKVYDRELKKILRDQKTQNIPHINPSKSFLILFEGSEESVLNEVVSFSEYLKKYGKKVKLLSYLDTKGELIDFGMAVYNRSSLNWYQFPKKHIFDLLKTSDFDVMINLNFNDRKHLHALACSANAKFKLSLPTTIENNFTMIIDTKTKDNMRDILDEILVYFDILSI
ncbi:MAG: hypothetical protein R2771_15455 [Saprospiraceae bacterium]